MSFSRPVSCLSLVHFFLRGASSQYSTQSANLASLQYDQHQTFGKIDLRDELDSHPDVSKESDLATRKLFHENSHYTIAFPHNQDYVINLIVNPCGTNSTNEASKIPQRALGYDCCMDHFWEGEYGYIKKELVAQYSPYAEYRTGKSDFRIKASSTEIANNIDLVDENGLGKKYKHSRNVDDNMIVDESCDEFRSPYHDCVGFQLRGEKSILMPPCTDNNQTVDASLDCFDPLGEKKQFCMQIGFAQTAFIFVCEGELARDSTCGTFIEIHVANGSPYDPESTLIGETKITTRVASGMVTTTIPLTYKNDSSRILCSIKEEKIRTGSMVLIKENAPECCCPKFYNTRNKLGSFFCPKKSNTRGGPFATRTITLEELLDRDKIESKHPICPGTTENEDKLMCSKRATRSHITDERFTDGVRIFTQPCDTFPKTSGNDIDDTRDLSTGYEVACPHSTDAFKACASMPASGHCSQKDSKFSFSGEVGKVTHVPKDPLASYLVSFNDGRTSYNFFAYQLEHIVPDDNYELWWVIRNKHERIVQKKKSFQVVWPRCTFDTVNDQYFPFAQLTFNGDLVEKMGVSGHGFED